MASPPVVPLGARGSLRAIKVIHTLVWAVFAGAIAAIPVAATYGQFGWVLLLSALVMVEVIVLALNRLRCPLTDVAAKYTTDRSANFDIYLPVWLAMWNKHLFGAMLVAGELFAVAMWLRR